MALELTVRHRNVRSPLLVVPTPDLKLYKRQIGSDSEFSSSDTPRKNKRKLSEPKRRTTDFSIKRLCPDSPGSACSESGRSEESTPERVHEDSRDSADTTSPDLILVKERLNPQHPHLRPPFMFPDLRHHPYVLPPFYYGQFPPGFPATAPHLPPGFPAFSAGGLPTIPSVGVHGHLLQHNTHNSSQEETSRSTSPRPSPMPVSTTSLSKHRVSKKKDNRNNCNSKPPEWDVSPKPCQSDDETGSNLNSSPESPRDSSNSRKCRKNYKNMTRERRVEANARERTRVHTISAAFDGLRHAVPSYSYNQKLSKLAILRIACSYINALSKLADSDICSPQVKDASFAECVDSCTRTIQTEGKARRRH